MEELQLGLVYVNLYLNVKIYYNVGAWVAILLYNEKKVCSQSVFERPNPSFERPTLGRWGVPWTAIISINLQFILNQLFTGQPDDISLINEEFLLVLVRSFR